MKLAVKDNFTDIMDDYAGTIIDTTKIREQYVILQKTAYALVSAEALENAAGKIAWIHDRVSAQHVHDARN